MAASGGPCVRRSGLHARRRAHALAPAATSGHTRSRRRADRGAGTTWPAMDVRSRRGRVAHAHRAANRRARARRPRAAMRTLRRRGARRPRRSDGAREVAQRSVRGRSQAGRHSHRDPLARNRCGVGRDRIRTQRHRSPTSSRAVGLAGCHAPCRARSRGAGAPSRRGGESASFGGRARTLARARPRRRTVQVTSPSPAWCRASAQRASCSSPSDGQVNAHRSGSLTFAVPLSCS